MTSDHLQKVYDDYLNDRNIDALLLVCKTYIRQHLPISDDYSQRCLIKVWEDIDKEQISNFPLWINKRIRSARGAYYKALKRSRRLEGQPFYGEEGLAYFDHTHKSSQPKQVDYDLSEVSDAIVKRAAEFIQLGYTQEEAARVCGVTPQALRLRFLRHRRKYLDR